MCGICGIASFAETPEQGDMVRRVVAMRDALEHRGGNGVGIEEGTRTIFGAARLAIRGLDDGAQPIIDRPSGVIVVCNGEIDNHRELRAWLAARGRAVQHATDVAVISGLYLELGEAFAERLVGAFALALWDPAAERLVLARDRAGERPLFFTRDGEEVSFATEIAALAGGARTPFAFDRAALAGYMRFGAFVAPTSPFAAVEKVRPAEIVTIDAGGVRRQRYWRWDIVARPKRPPELEAFDRVFRGAVERQSDVDVPFGLFISGGVDSSLVAAVARDLRPDVPMRSYTLRFRESSYDEGDYALDVARRLDIEPVPVWVEAKAFPDELRKLIRLVGEPLADPAWIPTALLAHRAGKDVPLILVGEGADELFGGYPTYIGAIFGEGYRRLPAGLRAGVRNLVGRLPPSEKKVTLSSLLRRFVDADTADGFSRHLLWTSTIAPELLRRLGVAPPDPVAMVPAAGEILDRVQQHDLETLLAEGLLTKADRASMSSAVELRAPFLDREVMEFAAGLPRSERIRGVTTKAFLKRYALKYLPRNIVYRRKRGLSVPLGGWLRGPLADWAAAALGAERLKDAGLDPAVALALFDDHRAFRADHARALWTLIVLSEWVDWAKSMGSAGADAALQISA